MILKQKLKGKTNKFLMIMYIKAGLTKKRGYRSVLLDGSKINIITII